MCGQHAFGLASHARLGFRQPASSLRLAAPDLCHASLSLLFEDHLNAPRGLGALAGSPHSGAAGGAACGDLIRVAVRVEGDRIAEAGFDAEGCGAARAAGSAVVELVEGKPFPRRGAGHAGRQWRRRSAA